MSISAVTGRYVSKDTRSSLTTQANSREIRAPPMQPKLFLEKYAPQPCNPSFFSKNARPSHATQAFSREMRLQGGAEMPPHTSCSKWSLLRKNCNLQQAFFFAGQIFSIFGIPNHPILEQYAPQPSNPSFFSRNTRPSHATQAFSREIRAPAMQPKLFLGKCAPQPCNPCFFSKNTRPSHATQAFSREMRLQGVLKCLRTQVAQNGHF